VSRGGWSFNWFVMLLISGPGPPLEVLPTTLQCVGDVTPLKHVVLLLQDPWFGFGWNGPQALAVATPLL
jgi:hypothetical protein